MIFEHTDYRSYLKGVLVGRIRTNPAYSLRAFAKNLDLAPSMLSEVLRGKKKLSPRLAFAIASRLNLSSREAEYFTLLTQLELATKADLREKIREQLQKLNSHRPVHDLTLDHFKCISDWYHLPILELTYVMSESFTPKAIAKRLGISAYEAEAAIERLQRLGLLEKDAKGKFTKAPDRWIAASAVPNDALRRFHKQMLGKAAEAIDSQTNEQKFTGTETFPFDLSQLPRARAILEKAFQEMQELSASGRNRTHVYHLGIQLFNLTPERKKS